MLFRNPFAGYLHPRSYTGGVDANDWKITQNFGCTGFSWEPAFKTCSHFHRGLDIWNGRSGDPVYAPAAGTVRWSGVTTDGSQSIVISHGNGWASSVGHLKSRLVATGAKVSKGQKIGYHDTSGRATGPHIHFAIKRNLGAGSFYADWNGDWVDPWPRLEQNVKVRLASSDGIRIRTSPGGTVYATAVNGRIIRASDKKDLGSATAWRKWGGNVRNTALNQDFWRKILLGSTYYYVGNKVSQQSMS